MTNESIRAAVEKAERVFTAKPAVATSEDQPATARALADLSCEISSPSGARAASAIPQALGGSEDAPPPGWYFRAALASCLATAIRLRAARIGIALTEVEVTARSRSDKRGLLGMGDAQAAGFDLRMEVKIGSDDASPEQLRELVRWCDAHSPVGSTLRAAPECDMDIEVTHSHGA